MSTTPTEAHLKLARIIRRGVIAPENCAQLIADSEARAVEAATNKYRAAIGDIWNKAVRVCQLSPTEPPKRHGREIIILCEHALWRVNADEPIYDNQEPRINAAGDIS